MMIACGIIILILWFVGFYFLARIPLCETPAKHEPLESLSIVIPARNEEKNIVRLLRSIQSQSITNSEIIVVNDQSTDQTKKNALECGARVIDSSPLPDGWTGKNWACHQGAAQASGRHLLFLDADTFFEPEGMNKLLHTYKNRSGVLSVAPYHKIGKLYENFSAFFNVAMMGGVNVFTLRGDKTRKKGLFGQCMLVEKTDYLKSGGHEAVKNKILENFFLAEKFRKNNVPINCVGGKGTLSFRMFPNGIRELIEGWSKAFAAGAGNTPGFVLFSIILWFFGGIAAFLYLLYLLLFQFSSFCMVPAVIIYLLYCLQTAWMLRRIGNFRIYVALFYPLYLLFYIVVFFHSLYLLITKKQVKWKDRNVMGTAD